YRKYGLLRELGRAGLRTLVCWLLTQNDGRSDGSKTGYLDQPARLRRYDPEVFDLLRAAVRAGRRSVSVVEGSPLFPGCGYHSEVLHPGLELRAGYFETLYAAATGHDVVL